MDKKQVQRTINYTRSLQDSQPPPAPDIPLLIRRQQPSVANLALSQTSMRSQQQASAALALPPHLPQQQQPVIPELECSQYQEQKYDINQGIRSELFGPAQKLFASKGIHQIIIDGDTDHPF
ncbi:8101_t:CDS:1 [Acaulospora morrowiae]|uniref:8101_t:CDS:1 n=1 Tax=Acaulospora morrowiae TaxID=94023 RepID=A0A9N9ATV0_9GLOM|nr:8101_t:CDS:1 [Acaulospora morrowiae]